ncbi:hypothetical protein Pyn_40202 [Prunus yedoensis var. nudiflora]|uniref:Uncharacterized protein n=1 Tax=Prunus yedoensis var. nudiflora TaxID=2094558 RepID=A0A314XLY3_PRUYE|nr:hypothetical protein Pyn_40202 [Prunus yedoensis var. nudiflora]
MSLENQGLCVYSDSERSFANGCVLKLELATQKRQHEEEEEEKYRKPFSALNKTTLSLWLVVVDGLPNMPLQFQLYL